MLHCSSIKRFWKLANIQKQSELQTYDLSDLEIE